MTEVSCVTRDVGCRSAAPGEHVGPSWVLTNNWVWMSIWWHPALNTSLFLLIRVSSNTVFPNQREEFCWLGLVPLLQGVIFPSVFVHLRLGALGLGPAYSGHPHLLLVIVGGDISDSICLSDEISRAPPISCLWGLQAWRPPQPLLPPPLFFSCLWFGLKFWSTNYSVDWL